MSRYIPKRKTEDNPIFYKSKEEMFKPLSELMDELRSDIARIRGKLYDIQRAYGWEDRIDFLEGGLTCMVVAMASTQDEWKRYEEKMFIKEQAPEVSDTTGDAMKTEPLSPKNNTGKIVTDK